MKTMALLGLGFWILALGLFGGQTLHVAVNGDDGTGDGSAENPLATITAALDRAQDGAEIIVGPGEYTGRIRLRGNFATPVTVRAAVPYTALLRHNGTVITCYTGVGIRLEGFDIAHDGPGAAGLVIQIQDLRSTDTPGGNDPTRNITIENNIIHDSYNNDLLKINNGARDITVRGNLFFNQQGSDEHMDVNGVENIVIEDNIFFNHFEGSGRPNGNDTSSFIVVKNSGELAVNRNFTIRRNVFLNWQGSTGSHFILFGEDGKPFFEAEEALVENNLMLGNATHVMRAAFGVKGSRNITFRNNTVHGDLPALAYAMRLNREGNNPPVENVHFYNNIWSDPTGTMGAGNSGANDFSDSTAADVASFELTNNLYWNGGSDPPETGDLVNPSDDTAAVTADPILPDLTQTTLPTWLPQSLRFASGNTTIRAEFLRLVNAYGVLGAQSGAVDVADPANAAGEDILGRTRGANPDIGAFEQAPCVLIGDLNNDAVVDLNDVYLLASRWLSTESDLDADGRVTVLDLVRQGNGPTTCLGF
ncbi:hypothetical protein APED_21110 [Acanthopleuribacter pedis]